MRAAWAVTAVFATATCGACAVVGEPLFMALSGLLALLSIGEVERRLPKD